MCWHLAETFWTKCVMHAQWTPALAKHTLSKIFTLKNRNFFSVRVLENGHWASVCLLDRGSLWWVELIKTDVVYLIQVVQCFLDVSPVLKSRVLRGLFLFDLLVQPLELVGPVLGSLPHLALVNTLHLGDLFLNGAKLAGFSRHLLLNGGPLLLQLSPLQFPGPNLFLKGVRDVRLKNQNLMFIVQATTVLADIILAEKTFITDKLSEKRPF